MRRVAQEELMKYTIAFRFSSMSNRWSIGTTIFDTEGEARDSLAEKLAWGSDDTYYCIVPLPDLDSLEQYN